MTQLGERVSVSEATRLLPWWGWLPMVVLLRPGDEIREYSDMRGPLDGDGGYALVRRGRVVFRAAVWLS